MSYGTNIGGQVAESWNNGKLECWKTGIMDLKRKNINRGFTKLRVWENSIDLYTAIEFPDLSLD